MKLIFWSTESNLKHYICVFKSFGATIVEPKTFGANRCFFVIDTEKNVTGITYENVVEYTKTDDYKLASYQDVINRLANV